MFLLLVYNSFCTMSSSLCVGLKLHSKNIAILKFLQKEVPKLTLLGCVGGASEMQTYAVG